MRFEARELKPLAEPVSNEELRAGETYFALLFVDDHGLIPSPEDGPRQKKVPHSSREHAKSGEYVPKETSS
jgi:hypothetical protein